MDPRPVPRTGPVATCLRYTRARCCAPVASPSSTFSCRPDSPGGAAARDRGGSRVERRASGGVSWPFRNWRRGLPVTSFAFHYRQRRPRRWTFRRRIPGPWNCRHSRAETHVALPRPGTGAVWTPMPHGPASGGARRPIHPVVLGRWGGGGRTPGMAITGLRRT